MVELRFATVGMGKVTVLAIGFAVGLAFSPAANAHPGDVSFVQSLGLYAAPIPQEQPSSCDSNYSGACVPVASDVDCAGGSGNGPAYVSGPVTVVGNDIYGLVWRRQWNWVRLETQGTHRLILKWPRPHWRSSQRRRILTVALSGRSSPAGPSVHTAFSDSHPAQVIW